jgi:hypothetical protein
MPTLTNLVNPPGNVTPVDSKSNRLVEPWLRWFISVQARFNRPGAPAMPTSTSYANDAAAAAGGVQIGEFYRNGSVVQCRIT